MTETGKAISHDKEANVPGPVPGTRMTPEYVRMVGRDAYFWGWPMVNVYDRRLAWEKLPASGWVGPICLSPPNHLCMLTDYVVPEERVVACPNQDVVYGIAALALDKSPVVVQVPDFGGRFWVYQLVDLRTDSFAELGTMYGSKSGFYLVAGPHWDGPVPEGITEVFRCPTSTGIVIPRVFQDDTAQDKKKVQPALSQVTMYPLAEFDGKLKSKDWHALPTFPAAPHQGDDEVQWVHPETFFDVLPTAMNDAPPLPGEQARYAQIRSVLEAAALDPRLKEALTQAAAEADKDLVAPVFEFRNYGLPLPHNWTTQNNGAAYGTDYFTRTAVCRSNIFVNKPIETKYFYQDLDASGERLNGANLYALTLAKNDPPVKGFWSLTLYNQHHFFEPNDLKRYSLGTKTKTLQYNSDGSLTLYAGATSPGEDKVSNWLPAPNGPFSLYIRAYWPEKAILDGSWLPPKVQKV